MPVDHGFMISVSQPAPCDVGETHVCCRLRTIHIALGKLEEVSCVQGRRLC